MKHTIWLCITTALLVAGCAIPRIGGAEFINHPRPELALDLGPFRSAGCLPEEYGNWSCPEDGPVAALECDRLTEASDLLGALEPAAAIMECHLTPFFQEGKEDPVARMERIKEEGFFYGLGCMAPGFVRYVIFQDGEFRVIKTEEEFRDVFAPVSSPEEALSYALAVTGHSAYFGQDTLSGYRYLVDSLEDTHVEERDGGGYGVNLFHYQFCGCGPHSTLTTEVVVSADGQVARGQFTPVYENPEEDNLCVD